MAGANCRAMGVLAGLSFAVDAWLFFVEFLCSRVYFWSGFGLIVGNLLLAVLSVVGALASGLS